MYMPYMSIYSIWSRCIECGVGIYIEAKRGDYGAPEAFHEHIDSFGAFPYLDGGEGRLSRKEQGLDAAIGACMGCAKAPFTGSVVLKQCRGEVLRPRNGLKSGDSSPFPVQTMCSFCGFIEHVHVNSVSLHAHDMTCSSRATCR